MGPANSENSETFGEREGQPMYCQSGNVGDPFASPHNEMWRPIVELRGFPTNQQHLPEVSA